MLVPATIALLVLLPLALQTKSADVDVHLLTHRVSFKLLSAWDSGQEVELIRSIPVKSVIVSIDSITIQPAELVELRSGSAIKASTVQLHPRKDGWVSFSTDTGGPVVRQVRLTAGSHMDMVKEGRAFEVGMQPNGRVHGEIILNGPVTLTAQDCDLVDQDGRSLSGLEEHLQQRFGLKPAIDPVVFDSTHNVDLQMELDDKESQFLGALSDFLRITDATFPPGNDATAVPIQEGEVVFRSIEKPALNLKSAFFGISKHDQLQIVTIGDKAGALDLVASGEIRSLKYGKAPHPESEELPNMLDWLYHNQKLGIVFAVLVWVSGTVLAAVKLTSDLKKT